MSNVTRFGAVGDGVVDDTESIRHAVNEGDGMLHFPPGTYRITQPIEVRLAKRGPLGIDGTGGTARIVMAGKGPAFRLIGTHGGTGDPVSDWFFRNSFFPRKIPVFVQPINPVWVPGLHAFSA